MRKTAPRRIPPRGWRSPLQLREQLHFTRLCRSRTGEAVPRRRSITAPLPAAAGPAKNNSNATLFEALALPRPARRGRGARPRGRHSPPAPALSLRRSRLVVPSISRDGTRPPAPQPPAGRRSPPPPPPGRYLPGSCAPCCPSLRSAARRSPGRPAAPQGHGQRPPPAAALRAPPPAPPSAPPSPRPAPGAAPGRRCRRTPVCPPRCLSFPGGWGCRAPTGTATSTGTATATARGRHGGEKLRRKPAGALGKNTGPALPESVRRPQESPFCLCLLGKTLLPSPLEKKGGGEREGTAGDSSLILFLAGQTCLSAKPSQRVPAALGNAGSR